MASDDLSKVGKWVVSGSSAWTMYALECTLD